MEKQILTALLVLVLVAPQTGLEAKSRHHGVKDRDHDAEERDHENKKRYHKSKKRHHKSKKHHHSWRKFIKLARATKAELELLKQAISEMNAKMEALEPQGQLPGDLAEQVDANTSAIGVNTSAIGANTSAIGANTSAIGANTSAIGDNTSEITMALEETMANAGEIAGLITRLDLLEPIVEDHELRISALESGPETPDGEKLVFSGHFILRNTPDAQLVQDWVDFRSIVSLYIASGGLYTSIEIRGSVGGGVSCSDPGTATAIANALGSGQTAEFNCENRVWNVGAGQPRTGNGGIELNAGSIAGTGNCSQEASVRPLMGNSNWGGIGLTCVAPSQTLEVILTLKNTVL